MAIIHGFVLSAVRKRPVNGSWTKPFVDCGWTSMNRSFSKIDTLSFLANSWLLYERLQLRLTKHKDKAQESFHWRIAGQIVINYHRVLVNQSYKSVKIIPTQMKLICHTLHGSLSPLQFSRTPCGELFSLRSSDFSIAWMWRSSFYSCSSFRSSRFLFFSALVCNRQITILRRISRPIPCTRCEGMSPFPRFFRAPYLVTFAWLDLFFLHPIFGWLELGAVSEVLTRFNLRNALGCRTLATSW